MKRALAAVAIGLALAGCTRSVGVKGDSITERQVELRDGRTVTCIVFSQRDGNSGQSGLSCDWGAR